MERTFPIDQTITAVNQTCHFIFLMDSKLHEQTLYKQKLFNFTKTLELLQLYRKCSEHSTDLCSFITLGMDII